MTTTRQSYLLYIIAIITLTIASTSCENKWPKNGDFDGMWQLMTIEQNGTTTSLKATKHYWSVRTNLVQFNQAAVPGYMFSHFQRRDGKLILTDFSYNWGNTEETKNNEWIKSDPPEERDTLRSWGIYPDNDTEHPERLTQTFTIDHLDSDEMILSAPTYRLHFRKF